MELLYEILDGIRYAVGIGLHNWRVVVPVIYVVGALALARRVVGRR